MVSNDRIVNVGVWGLGRHALNNILPAIDKSGTARLCGVYTRNRETLRDAANRYGCRYWLDEVAFLEDRDIDAVYLATPVGLHEEQGLKVLDAEKHLICEKSLGHSRAASLSLIERARERSKLLCETFMFLYHPQFTRLYQILAKPEFGEVSSVTCNFCLPHLEHPGYRYARNLGGGAFLDAGCYLVSMMLALRISDEMPIVRASLIRKSGDHEVDTSGLTLLEFDNGLHAYLNWGYGLAYKNEVSIVGEKQSLYCDFAFSKKEHQETTLKLFDQFGKCEAIPIEPANSFVEMLSSIGVGVSDEMERDRLLLQAERQAELMELIKKSARQGQI